MQTTYKKHNVTSITVLNNPKHPHLLAYSRLMDRVRKLEEAGKLKHDGGTGNWVRYEFTTKDGSKKYIQVSDRVLFPGDDIKYTVSISFFQFN